MDSYVSALSWVGNDDDTGSEAGAVCCSDDDAVTAECDCGLGAALPAVAAASVEDISGHMLNEIGWYPRTYLVCASWFCVADRR